MMGGAGFDGAVERPRGRSDDDVLGKDGPGPVCDGRLASLPCPDTLDGPTVEVALAVVDTADDKGAKEFFIRENKLVTRVYPDWSFSSSSANGLKDVRLETSSSFALLLLLEDWPLIGPIKGEVTSGDSMALAVKERTYQGMW